MNSRNGAGANGGAGRIHSTRIPDELRWAIAELVNTNRGQTLQREDIAQMLLEYEPRWYIHLFREELRRTMVRSGLRPIEDAATKEEARRLVRQYARDRSSENNLKLDVITSSMAWLRRHGMEIFWCGAQDGYISAETLTPESAEQFVHSKLMMMANLSDRMHTASEVIQNGARGTRRRETARRLSDHINLAFDHTFNLELAEEVLMRFSNSE